MVRASALAILLMTASAPAMADPISVAVVLTTSAMAASSITAAGALTFSWGLFALNAAVGLGYAAFSAKAASDAAAGVGGKKTVNVREAAGARQTIYGRQKVGGKLIFVYGGKDTDGSGRFLHLVFAMAGHQCDAFEEFYINDRKVTLDSSGRVTDGGKFAGLVKIQTKLGTQDQTAFADLIAATKGKWTADHRGRGVTLMYVRIKKSQKLTEGIPNFSAVIRGKLVKNLITGVTAWSQNAVWCINDRLMMLGTNASNINLQSWRTAGMIADETVQTRNGPAKRMTCNGVVSEDATPKATLETMLSTTAGSIFWTGGEWQIAVGAWSPPVAHYDMSDLRGPLKIMTRQSRSTTFDAVKGQFSGAQTDWAADSYPAVRTSESADRFKEINFPFTDNSAECQALARIMLYRELEPIGISTSFGLRGLFSGPGDVITLSLPRYGFERKTFEIKTWQFIHRKAADSEAMEIVVDVTLRETSAAVFSRTPVDERVFERNNTTLDDPADGEPPSFRLDAEIREANQTVTTVLMVDITTEGESVANEVQYRPSGSTRWISLGRQDNDYFEALNVRRTEYDVRVRTYNIFGVPSDWAYRYNFNVSASLEPPGIVTGFEVDANGDTLHFSWDPVAALDLSHYLVRWTPRLTGATWANSTIAIKRVSRPATSFSTAARNGTYLIRAVNKTDQMSPAATLITVTGAELAETNIVQTITESPSFSGVKDSTYRSEALPVGLSLSSAAANIVPGKGYYYFATPVDLGAVYTSRISAHIEMVRFELAGLMFDDAPGFFDARDGLFENEDTSDLDAYIQISTRNASVDAWEPWRKITRGSVTARFMRFRAVLETQELKVSPKITELRVTVDMPDRHTGGANIVAATGGTAISFGAPYRVLKGIGIAAQNLNTGDYYRITNKTVSGFTIRFFNSSDTAISRTFDWTALGIGSRS